MQRAVWRSKRPTTQKIVLLAILDHYSDSSPEPLPSVARLAEHCASTSVWRDKKHGTLLPVAKAVRADKGDGDTVTIELRTVAR